MGLKRTKLLGVQSITGISTVGILTVGTTQTTGGVGIASTSYIRGVIMHNTGLELQPLHCMFILQEIITTMQQLVLEQLHLD